MISTPLRMEKPVRRPIVPPISPSWASVVTLRGMRGIKVSFSVDVYTFEHIVIVLQRLLCTVLTLTSLSISSYVAVSKKMYTSSSGPCSNLIAEKGDFLLF